jgi:hypothetical protein
VPLHGLEETIAPREVNYKNQIPIKAKATNDDRRRFVVVIDAVVEKDL